MNFTLDKKYLDIQEEARRLAASVAHLAAEADECSTLHPDIHAALRASKLGRLMVPAQFGGSLEQVDPLAICVVREVLMATPRSLREASLALGATRSEAIAVALDAARPGILGAVILALGRALGETMAVTMVIGNTNRITGSILSPGATMASIIANEFTEATGALYLSAVCILPELLIARGGVPFYFGGTSLLIVVSVTLDTVTQIETLDP